MGTCKNCVFWECLGDEPILAENNDKTQGWCHKDSPRATPIVMPTLTALKQVVPQVLEMTLWPITTPIMWCGQFEKANEVSSPVAAALTAGTG
ncbi:hypothetical protein LCGC14_2825010 [marine sediment metagenome]|uniref:Uncharacterized protein n=1 Tax=marine sediment metagenome TaxID=412755 RepID=A0A0F8Z2J9_9ZZZZ